MGMDVILGAMVVIAALRGWFRGFFAQAIRIGGLVGGIYLAAPLRDLARPIVAARLTSMTPELLDRLLWWVALVVAFVVLTGVATGILMASRRRITRDRIASGVAGPSHRGDQSAGALLGAAKGAIVVAFLLSAIQPYMPEYVASGGWVGEQVETSYVLAWSARYEPARRLWEAEPVQALVTHVRQMGLGGTDSDADADPESTGSEDDSRGIFAIEASQPETQARAPARRPAPLAVESKPSEPPKDLQSALEEVRRDLEKLDALRNLMPR
ncbi:CvpA family protein [Tautonia marina]|uniref:CvpA family protein n=1 Tax=Tautonia marina TaxID=2653855 RepID=UPI001375DD73|nr:CvpA family protein [Tautonia marina]